MAATAHRAYRLISVDGHFNEPGDLWTSRVAPRYRDRVPRIESFPQGDAWVFPGFEHPVPFGWGACAGRRPEEVGPWCRFADIPRGSYDPGARLSEMDADRVDADVLFPSGATNTYIAACEDPRLHHEMVRAYNDFVSEFCAHAPERLGGNALLPNRGVKAALTELERVLEMPGFVGILLKCYPHGDLTLTAEDDPIWAAVEQSGKPLTIHIGLGTSMMTRAKAVESPPGTLHFYDVPTRILQFIYGGVLDRFPGLRIALIEVDCGWMPYFAEQADDQFLRVYKSAVKDRYQLTRMPSEYLREFFPVAFITDRYAIENRHRIGVERMMWSNDYPHITSDWPYSWRTINASFAAVPADERHAMLAGNAQRVFGFGGAGMSELSPAGSGGAPTAAELHGRVAPSRQIL